VQRSEALRPNTTEDSIEALDFEAELFDRETHRALDVVAGAAPKLRHINSTVCYAGRLLACETRCFGEDHSYWKWFVEKPNYHRTATTAFSAEAAAHQLHGVLRGQIIGRRNTLLR
jgi:hypothetical protein